MFAVYFGVCESDDCACDWSVELVDVSPEAPEFVLEAESGFIFVALDLAGVVPPYFAAALRNGSESLGGYQSGQDATK